MPKEVLRSRRVMLLNKGDMKNLEIHRPISLSNAIHKICAVILKIRVAENMELKLQGTQYGFRKNKSFKQAIQIIRRIMEIGERKSKDIMMVLLDWEKVFYEIRHDKLYEALSRKGLPNKSMRIIKDMYDRG